MGTHWKGYKNFEWSRVDCDMWMFNEAPSAKLNDKPVYPKPDAVFQLHHEAIWKNPKNRSDEKHYEWLKSNETPTVYMQKKYSEIPKAIEYPLKEILSLTKNVKIVVDGQEKNFKYFSSSPEYALALAALMYKNGKKYTRVEVWGIELAHESEYIYQRTGFAFWSGYLAGIGIELVLVNSIFDAPIYGYEGDIAISSQYLEKRIADLKNELGDDKQRYSQEAKLFLDSLFGLINADISSDIEKGLNQLATKNERTGILNGQIKECQEYFEKAQAMEAASGASIFSMGEFDGSRHIRNMEYAQVRNDTVTLNTKISLYLKRLLGLKRGSHKRKRAVDEIGSLIAEMMNKNMLLLHLIGAIKENQFFVDSAKLSFKEALEKK